MRLTICLALLCTTACAPERVRLATPPPELLQCAPEPEAPDLPERTAAADAVQMLRDTMVLEYILGLRSAWGATCANLKGVEAWAKEVG